MSRRNTDTRERDESGTDGENRTMADVSHTNPKTGETFSTVFHRGPAVADGGATASDRGPTASRQMRDVDHTPPNQQEPNRVWKRGPERQTTDGRSDGVHE